MLLLSAMQTLRKPPIQIGHYCGMRPTPEVTGRQEHRLDTARRTRPHEAAYPMEQPGNRAVPPCHYQDPPGHQTYTTPRPSGAHVVRYVKPLC